MSNPPNGYNTDASYNKFKGSYFNDDVDVSGGDIISRTGNLYLAPNSSIYTSSNQIQFNEEYQFTDFIDNVNVFGQLKNTYNTVEYDVGLQCEKTDTLVSNVATISPIVYDTQFKTTGFYWDSGLSTTVFNNNASFPNGSISSTAINNTSFVSRTGNLAETINGVKTFSNNPVFPTGSIPVNVVNGTAVNLNGVQTITATQKTFLGNIRLDGSLLVGTAGNVILTNATLQKIAFISDVSSGVGANLTSLQNQINTLTTNSVSLSASNIFTGATNQFSNSVRLDGTLVLNAGVLTLTNANLQKIQYLSTVSSDVQTQINTLTTNSVSLSSSNIFTGATNQFSNSVRLDGTLVLNAGVLTLTNANLQKIQYLSTVSSDVQTQITALGTRATTLETKTTKMSYMSVGGVNTTTILDGLISQTLSFTNTINNISTTTFGYISGLTSSAQTQISNLATKLTDISYSASTTTIANNLVFTGTLNNIIPTVFSYLSNLSGNIQDQINNLSTRISNVELVGTIIMSPLLDLQTTTNNKYLSCNGQAVSRTTYSALFAKFGELFGAGNGTTTFNLPNYQGMFLRGMGNQIINGTNYGNYNSTYAPDPDSIQNHTHSGQAGAYLGTNNTLQSIGYMASMNYAPASYSFANTGNMSSGRINDFETKPVSIGIYYYVRT